MAQAPRDQNRIPTLLATSSADGITPVTVYADPTTHRLYVDMAGSGTVTSVSVVTANGISGSVATATTTPAITLDISGLDATKIADGSISNAEFQRLNGVSSAIQTQLDLKAPLASPTFTGTVTLPVGLTGSLRADAGVISIQTQTNNDILAYQALGSDTKAETVGGTLARITTSGSLSDGTIRFIAVYIESAQTITGVKWWQIAQGSYTAENYNGVGLYSYSGGTLTLVASSTDDGNIWKAASNSINKKDFSSTYAAAPGIYFIALLYNQSAQTTQPTIGSCPVLTNGNIGTLDFTNSAKLYSTLSSQTSLPASTASSDLTVATGAIWLGLY